MDRVMLDYFPPILQSIQEIRGIAIGQQAAFEKLWNDVDNVMADQFIEDATENGISRWESILKITPKGTDTLDDRRFRILTRTSEQLPYTETVLRQKLAALCGEDGYTVEVDVGAYKLTVKVALTAKSNFDDVASMLRRIVPANMLIETILMYNQHATLSQYTHAELAQYTHNELRNEVLTHA